MFPLSGYVTITGNPVVGFEPEQEFADPVSGHRVVAEPRVFVLDLGTGRILTLHGDAELLTQDAYLARNAALADAPDEVYQWALVSSSGAIGRARYLSIEAAMLSAAQDPHRPLQIAKVDEAGWARVVTEDEVTEINRVASLILNLIERTPLDGTPRTQAAPTQDADS